jgi:hypothetical protein
VGIAAAEHRKRKLDSSVPKAKGSNEFALLPAPLWKKSPLLKPAKMIQNGRMATPMPDNITAVEAVQMAVKALQECASIVPTDGNDDTSEEEEDDVHTTAPVFINKLKSLVDDPHIDSTVWTADGTSFVIHEPKKLSEQLVKYFKSSKLKSFVRQLHFYGFKKIGGSRFNDWVYNHKYFQKHGRVMHKLRRKTCGPDQQIKNLQGKVESLQGSLAATQHKLGDMAVALMALLQHQNAATFLGTSKKGPNESVTLPAKRARKQITNGGGGGGVGGGDGNATTAVQPRDLVQAQQRNAASAAIKEEAMKDEFKMIPSVLQSFHETLGSGGYNAFGFNTPGALTPALELDFAEVDELLFSPAKDEYGQSLFSDNTNMVRATA